MSFSGVEWTSSTCGYASKRFTCTIVSVDAVDIIHTCSRGVLHESIFRCGCFQTFAEVRTFSWTFPEGPFARSLPASPLVIFPEIVWVRPWENLTNVHSERSTQAPPLAWLFQTFSCCWWCAAFSVWKCPDPIFPEFTSESGSRLRYLYILFLSVFCGQLCPAIQLTLPGCLAAQHCCFRRKPLLLRHCSILVLVEFWTLLVAVSF